MYTFKKLLEKKKYYSPGSRIANYINIIDNWHVKPTFKLNNNNLTKKKIFLRKNKVSLFKNLKFLKYAVKINNSYNLKPFNGIIIAKTLININVNLPAVASMNIGQIFTINTFFLAKKSKVNGAVLPLDMIPYDLAISNIFFKKNTLYVKSAGTSAKKLKVKKTKKLITIELPSSQIVCFLQKTMCYVGSNLNFNKKNFIEGKWGFSINKTKNINVRGVAKNPVDHPNGGRTKAKQPEKTPWGWIAKKNK